MDSAIFDPVRQVMREVADVRTRVLALAKCTLMLQRQMDLIVATIGPDKINEVAKKLMEDVAKAEKEQPAPAPTVTT